MIRIRVISRAGEKWDIEGKEGQSLMEAIRNAGLGELAATCGGCRSCATCHVYVDGDAATLSGILAQMSDEEAELLEISDHRRSNSRLACQVPVGAALSDVSVTIAPEG